jgi:hypothetical protein
MSNIAEGKYKKTEVSRFSLGYIFIKNDEKEQIVNATKSLVDNKYYELGNTMYKMNLEFTDTSLIISVVPIYNFSVLKDFGLNDLNNGSDEEFINRIKSYVHINYQYLNIGYNQIPLNEFIHTKEGQCYNFSELFYLLANERGLKTRIQVNNFHAWNLVKINGKWEKVDLSLGLQTGGDRNEVK